MRRREFIAGLAGAAAWPLAGRAQQPKLPVIGLLHNSTSAELKGQLIAAFHRGLAETGYVEGRNVAIEYRWAEDNNDRLLELAADLVRRKVAVIVTLSNTAAAGAAKTATRTIPIVFVLGGDPVRNGLVASLARPGGNLTGFSALTIETFGKKMELLRELVPAASSIAFLFNTTNPANLNTDVQKAADLLGLRLIMVGIRHPDELEPAFERIVQQRAAVLLVSADTTLSSHNDRIAALAIRHALPSIFSARASVRDGGLLSYGTNGVESHRQAGVYTGRILKGEKPSDLPVQQPTRFEMAINLRTAKALGLTVPNTLLISADEVIE